MIRIAHMFEGTVTGGVVAVLRNMLAHLDRRHFEPVLIAAQSGDAARMMERAGDPVQVLESRTESIMNGLLSVRSVNPVAYAKLYRLMRREADDLRRWLDVEQVDILHTHHHHHHLLGGMATRHKLPHIWHVHAIVDRRAMLGLQWQVFNRYAARYASRVVAISTAVRDALAPRVQARTTVVNNGIETARFRATSPGEARAVLGLSGHGPVVGMVGRFTPLKGVLDFIRMAGVLSKTRPRVRFVVVAVSESPAEQAHRSVCLRAIDEMGLRDRLLVCDSLRDPAGFMAGFDVVVHPTVTYEGFGLVVLEAHASGRPVVCTDCGGPRDILVDGVTGFFVPRGDYRAMADRVSRLLDDEALRSKMAQAALRRASEDRFGITSAVRKIEELYRCLAPARAASRIPVTDTVT